MGCSTDDLVSRAGREQNNPLAGTLRRGLYLFFKMTDLFENFARLNRFDEYET